MFSATSLYVFEKLVIPRDPELMIKKKKLRVLSKRSDKSSFGILLV